MTHRGNEVLELSVVEGKETAGMPRLLKPGNYLIGREFGSDIVLQNRHASRRHARIEVDSNHQVSILHLGSGNPTRVNGQVVDQSPLFSGDQIRIGSHTLALRHAGLPVSRPDDSALEDDTEIDISLKKSTPSIRTGIARSSSSFQNFETYFLTGDNEADQKRVSILLEAIAALNREVEADRILDDTVTRAIEVTGCERGLLLLRDSDSNLQIRTARNKAQELNPDKMAYSHSIPRRTMETGTPVVTLHDEESDDSDAYSPSILALGLRSVMCVPLIVGEDTIGALYVDSQAVAQRLNEADLALFTALGQQIGVALEKARLMSESLERQRMTMNLEVARTIQEGLRPKSDVSIPGISLAAESQSCDETNGDYLDFFELGEERLGFVVADVSGHGIGPAIIMSGTRGLFRAYRRKAPNIDGVLDQVNRDLHVDLQGANFVTFFYGEVDVHANTLTYGSAGHPPAVLINSHGHTELLPRTGIALGMFGDEKYESKTCPFEPGDLIAVYTDGLTEMAAPSGDFYGEDRLVEFLIENREAEPEQIIARLLTEIETFSDQAPRTDDITLLLARRT